MKIPRLARISHGAPSRDATRAGRSKPQQKGHGKCGLATALGLLLLCGPAAATVSVEFQLGAVRVPPGSVGVLVADADGDGFSRPADHPGAALERGARIGDDVIVAVLPWRALEEWGSQGGFADHLAVLDYETLGVAEGDRLALHVFPARSEGDELRPGEPHLTYRGDEIGDLASTSTMEFALPADGGAHLLAVLGPESGGGADLDAIDLTALPYESGSGSFARELSQTARHTYFLRLPAAGFLRISGPPVAGLVAELFGPDGALVASSEGSIAFAEELSAGFHKLVLRQADGAVGVLPYAFDFGNVDIRVVVPDVAVGRLRGRLAGFGRVGGAPGQMATVLSNRARPVNGFAGVANRGDRPDRLRIFGGRGNPFFRTVYFAPGNVTAAMVGRGFVSPRPLVAGVPPLVVRARFVPNRRRLVRRVGQREIVARRIFPTLVRATATGSPAAPDAARLRLQVR